MDSRLCCETTSALYLICSCFGKGAFQSLMLSLSSSVCFTGLKLYSFLSQRVFQGLPVKHCKSSSVPTYEWQASYTYDAFVQPSVTIFLWSELIEDSLTFKAHGRMCDLRFYLQFISTGWMPSSTTVDQKPKKNMTMKKWLCLFSLIDLSTHQDQIPRSYWIHISFLVAKVQATANKDNHVSREEEIQKVRCT